MRRFFVDPENFKEDVLLIAGDEFHHLKNVSRLEVGEHIEVLDGAGGIARAEIIEMSKREAKLKVLQRLKLKSPPFPNIEIVLSLPRFQKMDLIIQKAVELNAFSITPVVSDRSFIKTLDRDLTSKLERWKKISLEACKQSGRAWPMQFKEPDSLKNIINQKKDTPCLFLYEGDGVIPIKEVLASFSNPPETLTVFIGAEGGFSPEEVLTFKAAGLKPTTLGPLVLRVETACITILSVIQYHFNLMTT